MRDSKEPKIENSQTNDNGILGKQDKSEDLKFNQIQKARIEKREKEFEKWRTSNNLSINYEASIEIEKRINVPAIDNELINKEIELLARLPENHYFLDKQTEEIKTIKRELKELYTQRRRNFIESNKDIFYAVPEEILANLDFRDIGYLLSLPHHLEKMKKDGITHIIASTTSSIPYCTMLKKLNELLYPNDEPIKFLFYSTKSKGKNCEKQDKKLVNYFQHYPNAKIGAFDECASSDKHSKYNRRNTVTIVKNEVEKLLSTKVIGRYGVDTVFPAIGSGKQISLYTSSYGDEGSGRCLFDMSNCIEKDKILNRFEIKNFNSIHYEDLKQMTDSVGYERTKHRSFGLRNIEKLEKLAEIAHENYMHNPDSIWNPFNFKIRLAIDPDYNESEN